MNGLIGKKIGMTQVFSPEGEAVPVTVIQAGPCRITQLKTQDHDGYEAVQLGFEEVDRLNKPETGHLRRNKLPALKYLREFRVESTTGYKVGQQVDVSLFKVGDLVDVTGISKGKGFAGVVKRHHFGGGPKTHGQSDRHRAPGASSSGTTPGRLLKGKRMAGHMGSERVTNQNLRVIEADPARNILLVRGTVPGSNEDIVIIRRAIKARK